MKDTFIVQVLHVREAERVHIWSRPMLIFDGHLADAEDLTQDIIRMLDSEPPFTDGLRAWVDELIRELNEP